jgi:uncharacterized membrane protein
VARASAQLEVDGQISEAERLWYDLDRWPSFVEGFSHVVKLEGDWPTAGARLVWDSVRDGRGRVSEEVTAYEVRATQTVAVEDPRMSGSQTIRFAPAADGRCRVTLELSYKLKQGGPLAPFVDTLFVRRTLRDSLRRTLSRFARELRSDRELGV